MTYSFAVEAHHKIIGIGAPKLIGFRAFFAVSAYHALEKQTWPKVRALARSVSKLGGRS